MQDNKWVFGLIVILALVGFSVWGMGKYSPKKVAGVETQVEEPVVSGEITSNESYFDTNASVQYFYQPKCAWCIKQSEVLTELAKEGYRVKPMDALANSNYWKDFQVKGTPTFIAKNGDRLEGFHEAAELKTWFDAHK